MSAAPIDPSRVAQVLRMLQPGAFNGVRASVTSLIRDQRAIVLVGGIH